MNHYGLSYKIVRNHIRSNSETLDHSQLRQFLKMNLGVTCPDLSGLNIDEIANLDIDFQNLDWKLKEKLLMNPMHFKSIDEFKEMLD